MNQGGMIDWSDIGVSLGPVQSLFTDQSRRPVVSQYMQITVSVRPFYSGSFESEFPKSARALTARAPASAGQHPSRYDLPGQIDTLLSQTNATRFREVLIPLRDRLRKLHADAQDRIADRDLAGADTLLYRLEDIFEEIESGLD